jgi:nucleotide-binding universal stress UspA family protein
LKQCNTKRIKEGLLVKEIKKILLPIDFSDASVTLLQYGVYLAEKYDARIFIVFVTEDPFASSGFSFSNYTELPLTDIPFNQLAEDLTKYARTRMENFLEKNMPSVSVAYQWTILSGHVAAEIISYAKKEAIDLIIIGTHGFKGLNRMLLGSVAEKVVKLAPCPVMTINAYREGAEAKEKGTT